MAFKAIWQTSENWLSELKNALFLCLLENIYKDTHFQPLDQIFKDKKSINKLLYIKHINQIFPKYCNKKKGY